MGLCKFFQQGNCRFGSKCNNEHVDIKQLIKVDVEAAINGKQWPFSCFGPFKDRPCIPNFIEDQSFEEIRYLCYESKQKNFFDQFHQQFTKEALEATNKMKALLQLTPEIVGIVSKLYDMSVSNGNVTATVKSNNPFGLGAPQAGNSFFGKTAANSTNNGNLFGSTSFNTVPNNSSTGMFGGISGQPQGSNLFGNSSGSVFGAAVVPNNQTSMFAQPVAKPAGSIFGVGTQGSVFGNTSISQPSNMFTQTAQQTSLAPPGGNLFVQPTQQTAPQTGFGVFGQAAQPAATPFGQQSFFGQGNQQLQQPGNTSNIFGQAMQTSGNNVFAQAVNQMQTQPVAGTNLFGQTAQQPPSGIFQQAMEQTQMQTYSQMVTPAAGANTVQSCAYSKLEDLTAEEIEAFKADRFMPGKVPFSPPPKELIN